MLTDKAEWKALSSHREVMGDLQMRTLFAEDPERFYSLSVRCDGLLLDYSKNRITAETMDLLMALARSCDVESKRDQMFAGEKVNMTEGRAVLHTALRAPEDHEVMVDGHNVMPTVHHNLKRMKKCADEITEGRWQGHTGKAINTVVNIGIGGSHLGPHMMYEALAAYRDDAVDVHFVANVDGADLTNTLPQCDPETTLFIVVSKSFSTQETLANAKEAKVWLADKLGEEAVSRHFVAVSNNVSAVHDFGISEENIFPMPDWIGGRFSVWSSVGLALAIGIGFDNFRQLLDGAYAMDRHFQEAPLEQNMPVILALLDVWYRNFWQAGAQAVVPYSYNLRSLPDYLKQLIMESNGKRVTVDGDDIISYDTIPVIFGAQGTNAQHSFFQCIHQGTDIIPCDFIGVIEPCSAYDAQHKMLLANMLGQAQALMEGREDKANRHRDFSGDRPSHILLLDRLDPFHLGLLTALYEHRVFVQGVLWGINSFDQWGVELGKVMANDLLAGEAECEADSSTKGLMAYVRNNSVPD